MNVMDIRDLCRRCRESVSAEEAARRFGLDIKHGKALCPFHDDQRPSLSFKDGFFRCFSCGAHGDSISFTAQYFGLRPIDAVRKLDSDFNLHLPLDRPQTSQEAIDSHQKSEEAEAMKMFRDWKERTLTVLCVAYRTGHKALISGRELTGREAYAVRIMDRIEYYIEVLEGNDQNEQQSIYRRRGDLKKLCRTVLQMTSGVA